MWLTVRTGEAAGTRVELTGERYVVGREEGCELVLVEEKISRRHAQLEAVGDGRYLVRDLGSTNGTFVNGQRISAPVLLQGGEELRFGDTAVDVGSDAAGAPVPARAAPTALAAPLPRLPAAAPAPAAPAPPGRSWLQENAKWVALIVGVAAIAGLGAALGVVLTGGDEPAAAEASPGENPEVASPVDVVTEVVTVPAETEEPPPPETEESPPPETAPPTQLEPGQIVWASKRDGDWDLYLMNPDGGLVAQLTNEPSVEGNPAVSPDRARIAFVSERDGDFELYVMNVDGTGVVQVTSNTAVDTNPSWSPDGTRLVYQSRQNDEDDNEVWVVGADGSAPTQLTSNETISDAIPSFSPDGTRIAYESYASGNWDVWVMNADGSGAAAVGATTAAEGAPRWSPDGSRLAYGSDAAGNWDVWVMNADGSGQVNVTNSPLYDGWPRWTPDGARVVFYRSLSDTESDVFSAAADGSGAELQLTSEPGFDVEPEVVR
ncbi:MAG: PD40 domain-containing protein [Thermoleophilia bacterium]|nr:PD40 domain-containing protein [Thermoleophilia bacterium]